MRRRTTAAVGGAATVLLAALAGAALAFPSGAVVRATSRPVELPRELQQTVFWMCEPGLYPGFDSAFDSAPDGDGVDATQGFFFSSKGSGASLSVAIEEVGNWSVSVDRTGATIHNERPSADQTQLVPIASEVIPAATSLYNCLEPYHFASHDVQPPSSGAQLLQLYRYDTAVLWPCLTAHGMDVGDPPSRDQFIDSFSALTADPISAMTVTPKLLPRLGSALRACPLRPAYPG
ncbi:MAG: hypothetical protein ABUL47_00335 [Leifsonia sp.]